MQTITFSQKKKSLPHLSFLGSIWISDPPRPWKIPTIPIFFSTPSSRGLGLRPAGVVRDVPGRHVLGDELRMVQATEGIVLLQQIHPEKKWREGGRGNKKIGARMGFWMKKWGLTEIFVSCRLRKKWLIGAVNIQFHIPGFQLPRFHLGFLKSWGISKLPWLFHTPMG